MDAHSKWKHIIARFRRQISLDIERCSPLVIRQLLLDARTPADVLDRIAGCYYDDIHILQDLVRCPNLSETTMAFIALTGPEEIKNFISGTRVMDLVVVDDAVAATGEQGLAAPGAKGQPSSKKKKLNLQQQIAKMAVSQKIRLAIMGGKEARGLLIRDTNKQVSTSVLHNARITDGEVESFAQSKNLNEEILRIIGSHPEWPKKYFVAVSLVNNPKTPLGISLPLVNRMTDRDLAMLEKSRNVTEPVRAAARGLLAKKKMKK